MSPIIKIAKKTCLNYLLNLQKIKKKELFYELLKLKCVKIYDFHGAQIENLGNM